MKRTIYGSVLLALFIILVMTFLPGCTVSNELFSILPSRTPTKLQPTVNNEPTLATLPIQTIFPQGHIILEEGFENGVENTYLDAEGSGWQVFEDEHGNHFICNMNVDKRELSLSVGEENWENYQLKIDAKDIKFDFSDPAFLHMEVRRKGIATYSFTVNFVSYQNSTSTFTNEASHVYFSKTEMSGEFIRILEKYLEPPIENQWYPVIVNLKDSNITFYWNDEIVIDHNDNQYLSEGSIRISANYGVCLDNIQITAIGNNE
jgi:hypothetical protein